MKHATFRPRFGHSVLLLALALSTAAAAQVKIGLMVSATGPTTAIGIPQKLPC